jgi:trehalose/maltose hydrolase-like predicted phosphorylase
VWQAVILGFGGVNLMGETLVLDPKLPTEWASLSFRLHWRGRRIGIRVAGKEVQATLEDGDAMDLRIGTETKKLTRDKPLRAST